MAKARSHQRDNGDGFARLSVMSEEPTPPVLPDRRRLTATVGHGLCVAYAIILPVYLVTLLPLLVVGLLFFAGMSADNGPNRITTGIIVGGGAVVLAALALLVWHAANIIRAVRARADPPRAHRLLLRTAWVGLPLMAVTFAGSIAIRLVRHHQTVAAQRLLQANAEQLNDAIARGDNATVQTLWRVNVNAVTTTAGVKRVPVLTAVQTHNLDALRILVNRQARLELSRGQGLGQPLIQAVAESDPAAVRTLLQLGADPNVQDDAGNTPLIVASSSPSLPHRAIMIHLLLARHARPDVRNAAGKDALEVAVTPRVRGWLAGGSAAR